MAPRDRELADLLKLARAGDKSAYGTLLRELAPILSAYYTRRIRGDLCGAEDFTQDCLLAIHQRQITYDASRPLLPWVYAIAKHKLIDRLRSRFSQGELVNLDDDVEGYDAEPALTARMDLSALLDKAPPKQRDAIIATKISGESVADYAAANDLSLSDVKVSVHRGLKFLARLAERKLP